MGKQSKVKYDYKDYWFNYVLNTDPLKIKSVIKEDFIVSNGLRIHLDIYGNIAKDPTIKNVIFIHGTSVYSRFYTEFCYNLFKNGFRIIAPDMVGHGLSEGKRGHFTMKRFTETIYEITTHIIEKYGDTIAIMGSSLGGITSLYSAAYDSRLKAAICHNAAIFNEKAHKRIGKIKGIKRFFKPIVPFFAKIVPNLRFNVFSYLPKERLANSELGFKIYDLLKNDKLLAYKYTLTALRAQMKEPLAQPIERIQTPIMIINGDSDGLFSVEYMKEIYDRLRCKEKTLEILKGSAHFIFQENIEEALKRIIPWLEKVL